MINKLICFICLVILVSCSATVKKDYVDSLELDDTTLRQMHTDVRYTYFYYKDGSVEDGLLLNWDIDSIKVKTSGEEQPKYIPSKNIDRLEIVTGNKMFKYLAWAAPLGLGAYLIADPPSMLGGNDEPSLAVLITPMAVISAMFYGGSKEKRQEYRVPVDFIFDYKKEKRFFDLLE